jgi:hypothetical protein
LTRSSAVVCLVSVTCNPQTFRSHFGLCSTSPLQFLAQFANRRLIIEVKNNSAEQVGRNAAPVLKWFFDKVGDGQNHPAQISGSYRYISESNLFDLPEFTFHHNDVIDQQRLGQRDLNTSKQVAERLLRSEADHDPCNSGRPEDADAELPHGIIRMAPAPCGFLRVKQMRTSINQRRLDRSTPTLLSRCDETPPLD